MFQYDDQITVSLLLGYSGRDFDRRLSRFHALIGDEYNPVKFNVVRAAGRLCGIAPAVPLGPRRVVQRSAVLPLRRSVFLLASVCSGSGGASALPAGYRPPRRTDWRGQSRRLQETHLLA